MRGGTRLDTFLFLPASCSATSLERIWLSKPRLTRYGEEQTSYLGDRERQVVFDVVTCGELLIDFVSLRRGVRLAHAPTFRRAAGGAPANVAVGVARLGGRAAFLGQVGDDDFGHFLAATLEHAGVHIAGLHFSREARTALAFVSLRADGERDFLFYRHPSADMLWRPEDVDEQIAAAARIFHFGSISLINEPTRSATLRALEIARQHGALISYDPNLRLNLWPTEQAAREGLWLGWQQANLIKLSEEELLFLTGSTAPETVRQYWHEQLQLVVITQGAKGCSFVTRNQIGQVPGYPVPVIDTTGAGDGFVAGLLVRLLAATAPSDSAVAPLTSPPTNLSSLPASFWTPVVIEPALRFANAVGALVCTRRGAIPALPTQRQVARFLRTHP